MKIFNKSLSSELIATATGAFVVLIGVVVAQRAGHLVRSAAKGWIPNDAIGTLLSFSLIKFLPLILSLSIFLTVLLTLSRWHRDSEMAVWFSSGLSVVSWIKPILKFALPVIIGIALLSVFITPWASEKIESYYTQLKSRDELATLSPGVFKETGGGNRVYFFESFDELGNVIKNIFVQSSQNKKSGVMVASQGRREKAANQDNFIVLEKGRRYETKPNTAEVSTTEFERYAIRVDPPEVVQEPNPTYAISSAELMKSPKPRAKAELHWRIAMPISAFILVLLAIPLSFVDPRAGRSLNMILAALVFIIYNNMLSIFQAWVAQGKIHTLIGLWPVHIIFALFTAYLFYRRTYLLPIVPKFFELLSIQAWKRSLDPEAPAK